MIDNESWILDNKELFIPLVKWQKTISVMARVFGAPAGFLVQYTPNGGYQVVLSCKQDSNPYPQGVTIPPDTNIFCRKIVETRQALYVKDASKVAAWDSNPEVRDDGFKSYLGLPVFWPTGQPFGTICVMDQAATDYSKDYVDLMYELRDLVQVDLGLIDQYRRLTDFAYHDDLTGLENRRSFMMLAAQRFALARRSEQQLGLVYIDMDDLKVVNDEFGHDKGDELLRRLSKALKSCARASDIPARIGGDEFVVLLACETSRELNAFVARLRHSLADEAVNASLGAVLIADVSLDVEYWIKSADDLMYQEKVGKKRMRV